MSFYEHNQAAINRQIRSSGSVRTTRQRTACAILYAVGAHPAPLMTSAGEDGGVSGEHWSNWETGVLEHWSTYETLGTEGDWT